MRRTGAWRKKSRGIKTSDEDFLGSHAGSGQLFADRGGYLGTEDFDGAEHFGMGEGGYAHLEG